MTLDKLKRYVQEHKAEDKATIVVGYSQDYALEQHERLDYAHKVGQAKYLETAARVSESDVRQLLRTSPSESKFAENMLKAGLLIQRRSQELCPVDTSALKSSAFTSVESEVDQKAKEAKAKGEAVRARVESKRSKKK